MPDLKLPQVGSRYGAPMGRADQGASSDSGLKFNLSRVRLDSGGYDNGGAYWGLGAPLYYALADDPDEGISERWFRARDREDAKRKIREEFPAARFYR